ncbi:substrate-binding domain-containing protein [Candidatus Amarobacter glycogenicus]|uniref:substrate-binding domain-containing protein n=1 Tax=Candidatus Amarobacter glycogenicus TaxID=3140699 RepID=UPI0031CCCC6B
MSPNLFTASRALSTGCKPRAATRLHPDLIVESNFRQRSGRQSALQLLDRPTPPTAIVACNDLLALGAISAVQERGLVVGQDVSITGFDDILLAEYANPPLTTVHQPAQQMGGMVAQMLTKIINGEPIEQNQHFGPFDHRPTINGRTPLKEVTIERTNQLYPH